MDRKNLPATFKKRNFQNDEVIVVKPSEVLKKDHESYTKQEMELLKIQGKLKILDKQNIGKGIDTLNNIVGLAKQIVEIYAVKVKSEAVLKEMDKQMELLEKEAEIFIKEEREKRDTIVIEHRLIFDIVEQIISVANNDSLSDEIKSITIEAITKAATK